MQRSLVPVAAILILTPFLPAINSLIAADATLEAKAHGRSILTSEHPGIINLDGDLSLSEVQDKFYWNPHSTGLTDVSTWHVHFTEEIEIVLETSSNEAGHVAAGAWWTTGFTSAGKIDLCTPKPVRLVVNFKINIVTIDLETGNEWLRIALACAVQRDDGSVVYTELDLWDSQTALESVYGNVKSGGNIVYKFGDVVEYKVDQAGFNRWSDYAFTLTDYIDAAWSPRPKDMLESVYFVVEVVGGVTAIVKADDLWIAVLD